MKRIKIELKYLNTLIREVLISSAAGFTALAVFVALITSILYIDEARVFLKQFNNHHLSELNQELLPLAFDHSTQVSSENGQGEVLIASAAFTGGSAGPAVYPPASIPPTEISPIDTNPSLPPGPPNDEIDSDKKNINDGTNNAGNPNSSFKANENSYDKDKNDS